jgi:hypothetical protein
MIQQSISEKIKNVNLLQNEDLNIFYELKNKHPFAEIFQLIHLKLVKKYDSFSFEEELGNVAYKIRDRHKLSSLLQESLETIIEPIIRNQEIITINEQIEILPDETKEELELVKENNIHSESKKEEELDVESANLNTQIAAEAFSTIFSKDFEPTIQFNLEEDHDKYTTLSDRLEIDSKNTSQIENKQSLFQEKSQKSFTSWLKSNKKVEKTDQTQITLGVFVLNVSSHNITHMI